MNIGGIDMKKIHAIGSGVILLLFITGISLAGEFDYNPGQEAIKYKHEMTDDVTGEGYVKEYKRINTNNLSLFQYSHGSGTIDQADILNSEQKTTHKNSYWVYNWEKSGGYDFREKPSGANSVISYTRQYDNIQSPMRFAWGTGYYAANPIGINSLLKDKTVGKSYQEAASMHRQIEYAHAVHGDIAVDINCTGATVDADGKGTLNMRIDDDVTQGTLHIGELLANPKAIKTRYHTIDKYKLDEETGKYVIDSRTDLFRLGHFEAWKDPIIEVDNDYIGNFQVQKNMKLEITKSKCSWAEDWLPCCHGGFFDMLSYKFDKQYAGQKGIFDCTCRNTSISAMKPKWNTSLAQFPTEDYRYVP